MTLMGGNFNIEIDPEFAAQKVRNATIVMIASQLAKFVCQMATLLILSRMLAPEDFGIAASCAPIIALAILFQDFGLNQSLIQAKKLDVADVSAVFWINLYITIFISSVLFFLAPLFSQFYQDQRIASVVYVLAIQLVVSGLSAQHIALASRIMKFSLLAKVEITASIVSLVFSTFWAALYKDYWAIIIGPLSISIVSTSLMWIFFPWRPVNPFKLSAALNHIRFGSGILGFNIFSFLSRNLDNVLIGRVWGFAELGYYDRAYKLLLLPINQVIAPLGRVMVPSLSRLHDRPASYREHFLNYLFLLLLVTVPPLCFATNQALVVVPEVLGKNWSEAARVFQVLGLVGLVQVLNSPTGWLFISQGRSSDLFRWGAFSAATNIAAFALGIQYGPIGVAICYACAEYLRTPFLWLYVCKAGPIGVGNVLPLVVPFYLASACALLIGQLLGLGNEGQDWTSSMASFGLTFVVFCFFILAHKQTRFRALSLFRKFLRGMQCRRSK